MRVFVDTNVVLDVLCDRQPFAGPAKALFAKIESGEIQANLSATTFTTIFYLARKQLGTDAAREAAGNLLRLFDICAVDGIILETALHGPFKDLEDACKTWRRLRRGFRSSSLVTVEIFRDRNVRSSTRKRFSPNCERRSHRR